MAKATMNKKILVIGKSGQLGKSIKELSRDLANFDFTFSGSAELDLSNQKTVHAYFDNMQFDIVINCAAYTAVDKAETEQNIADKVNNLAVDTLAKVSKQQGMTFIHVSTDYVFDGNNSKPYIETDKTNPQSVYGRTKLMGEQAFLQANPNGCIIRTSWVYSEYGNNFVKTILRLGSERDELGVIFDQVGSPTYALDLANAILTMVSEEQNLKKLQNKETEKIYHFSNEGVCSWYDFAKSIFELSGVECNVQPIETKDYPTPAARPYYSLMNKTKIKQEFELQIPYWKDSLRDCLKRLKDVN